MEFGPWSRPTERGLAVIEHEATQESGDKNPNRFVQRWRLDALAPNEFNATLFPDSLGKASIEALAKQIQEDGIQRVPIEITPGGTILDGERRWRAIRELAWEFVDVVVVEGIEGDVILDYVLAAYSSTRKPSLREQYLVYTTTVERLKATVGSQQGKQTFGNPNVWGIAEIRKAAAEKAGLSSVDRALKLKKLFEEGTEEQKAAVITGKESLSAVYDELSKREKAVDPDVPGRNSSSDDAPDDPEHAATEEGDIDDSPASEAEGVTEHDEHRNEGDADPGEDRDSDETQDGAGVEQGTDDVDATVSQAGGLADDTGIPLHDLSVEEALEVLAQHLEELVADEGLKAARVELQSWITLLFERAKVARSLAA